ncbi:MAG: terminase family protein [candidate division Zixibacteria bacterium]|nr:terminase family protein [candidate division Zixibacteria bacterium]
MQQNVQRFLDESLWLKAAADPACFAETILGAGLHLGQKKWLTNANKNENLLHAGNRWGKGEVQALKILHLMLFRLAGGKPVKENYRLANVSITQNQSEIVFRKILRWIKEAKWLEILVKEEKRTPFPTIRLATGAEISARTTQKRGEYLLGEGYDFINFDEAAFDPAGEYVADKVLAMRLADRGGMLDFTSTPKGRNWFYQRAEKLKVNPRWGYVQGGDTRENRFVNQEYLAERIRSWPENLARQNVGGEFVEDAETLLLEEEIERAIAASTGLSLRQAGGRYIAGWDLGRKVSFTTGAILDISEKPYQLVAYERFRHRSWEQVFQTIRKRKKEYGGPVMIDATGLGDVVLDELKDIKPTGFTFNKKTKNELLLNFKRAHEKGEIAYPYLEQWEDAETLWSLRAELESLNWEDNQEADFSFALALALWLLRVRESIVLPQGRWDKV